MVLKGGSLCKNPRAAGYFATPLNPRSVFLKTLINIVAATKTLSNLLFQQGSASHLNFKKVVKSTFIVLQRTNSNG